jgi:hypothetical protein
MSSVNTPGKLPLPRPHCPRCGALLRLVRIGPHPSYVNLDERFFDCVCGEEISDVVARAE